MRGRFWLALAALLGCGWKECRALGPHPRPLSRLRERGALTHSLCISATEPVSAHSQEQTLTVGSCIPLPRAGEGTGVWVTSYHHSRMQLIASWCTLGAAPVSLFAEVADAHAVLARPAAGAHPWPRP